MPPTAEQRRRRRRSRQGRSTAPIGELLRRFPALDHRFEAIVFDWDGTAVPDRAADMTDLRRAIEELCALGMDMIVVTGTHVGNVDGQLRARPRGPGRLHLCLNRGSEVFQVDERGPELVARREASADEDAALSAAAEATVARLAERGLRAEIVSQRLNRRKIDLIPEPEWADPPKARIAELLAAVEARLHQAGLGGLSEAVELAEAAAREAGLPAPPPASASRAPPDRPTAAPRPPRNRAEQPHARNPSHRRSDRCADNDRPRAGGGGHCQAAEKANPSSGFPKAGYLRRHLTPEADDGPCRTESIGGLGTAGGP